VSPVLFFHRLETDHYRLQAISRLFQIVLDINHPDFAIQDRQWRPCVVFLLRYFFTPLWNDSREEVRLAVETMCQTLLEPHLDAMTACFDEYLLKAQVSEREALVAFLIQLHPHFPKWQSK